MQIKKIIAGVMCIGAISSGFALGTANAAVSLGDVNGDSKVDSKDAVLVLKNYAENLAGKNTTIDKTFADVNADDSVDSKDAVWILKYYANTLTGYEKGISEFINGPTSETKSSVVENNTEITKIKDDTETIITTSITKTQKETFTTTTEEIKETNKTNPVSNSNIKTYEELKEHNSKATVEDYINSPQDFFMSENIDENQAAYAEVQNNIENDEAIANFSEAVAKVNIFFSSEENDNFENYFKNLELKDDGIHAEISDGTINDDYLFANMIPCEIYKNEINNCNSIGISKAIYNEDMSNLIGSFNKIDDDLMSNKDPYYELIRNLTKIHSLKENFIFNFSSPIPGDSNYNKDYITGYQTCSYIIPVEDENGNYGYVSYNSNNEVISFVLF